MLRSWAGMAAIGILMLLLCVLSIALMSPREVPSAHAIGRGLGFSTTAALTSSVLDLARALYTPESTRLTIQGRNQLMTGHTHNNVIAEGEALGNELAPEIIAAFENDPTIQETYFFDGGHPDAAGYPMVAERVYRKLQELRWLSRPAP